MKVSKWLNNKIGFESSFYSVTGYTHALWEEKSGLSESVSETTKWVTWAGSTVTAYYFLIAQALPRCCPASRSPWRSPQYSPQWCRQPCCLVSGSGSLTLLGMTWIGRAIQSEDSLEDLCTLTWILFLLWQWQLQTTLQLSCHPMQGKRELVPPRNYWV